MAAQDCAKLLTTADMLWAAAGLIDASLSPCEKNQEIQVLICGWSCRTAFNSELWTSMPPL